MPMGGRRLPRRRAGRQARPRLAEQGAVRRGGLAQRRRAPHLCQDGPAARLHAQGRRRLGRSRPRPRLRGAFRRPVVLRRRRRRRLRTPAHRGRRAQALRICPSSNGSTRSSATSRPASAAPTTLSSSPSTAPATWPPSPTASTAASAWTCSKPASSPPPSAPAPDQSGGCARLKHLANQVKLSKRRFALNAKANIDGAPSPSLASRWPTPSWGLALRGMLKLMALTRRVGTRDKLTQTACRNTTAPTARQGRR